MLFINDNEILFLRQLLVDAGIPILCNDYFVHSFGKIQDHTTSFLSITVIICC